MTKPVFNKNMSFLALADIIVTVYNAASDWLTLYTNHIIFSIITCITQELVIGLSGSGERKSQHNQVSFTSNSRPMKTP